MFQIGKHQIMSFIVVNLFIDRLVQERLMAFSFILRNRIYFSKKILNGETINVN